MTRGGKREERRNVNPVGFGTNRGGWGLGRSLSRGGRGNLEIVSAETGLQLALREGFARGPRRVPRPSGASGQRDRYGDRPLPDPLRGLVRGTSSQRPAARRLQGAHVRAHSGELQGPSLVLAFRARLRERLDRPRAVWLEQAAEYGREDQVHRTRPDGAPRALPARRPGHSILRHPGDRTGRPPEPRAEAVVPQEPHRRGVPPGERRPGA